MEQLAKVIFTIAEQPIQIILLAALTWLLVEIVKRFIPETYKSATIFVPFPVGAVCYTAYLAIVTRGFKEALIMEFFEATEHVSGWLVTQNVLSSAAMIGLLSILIFNVVKAVKNLIIEGQLDSERMRLFFKDLVNVIGNKRDTLTVVKKLNQVDWSDVDNCVEDAKTVLAGFVDFSDLDGMVNLLKGTANAIENEKLAQLQKITEKRAAKEEKKLLKKIKKGKETAEVNDNQNKEEA